MRIVMGHTAVSTSQASSVTNYSKYDMFKMAVNTKTN